MEFHIDTGDKSGSNRHSTTHLASLLPADLLLSRRPILGLVSKDAPKTVMLVVMVVMMMMTTCVIAAGAGVAATGAAADTAAAALAHDTMQALRRIVTGQIVVTFSLLWRCSGREAVRRELIADLLPSLFESSNDLRSASAAATSPPALICVASAGDIECLSSA